MNATPLTDFSKNPVRPPPVSVVVDVWLEAGRDGRTFTYSDGKQLNVRLGDLVQVSLRGRRMQGLVTACRRQSVDEKRALQPVEALLQQAAVGQSWRSWLEEMAQRCHTSPFRMLKAALPPGWLGQRVVASVKERRLWWVSLLDNSAGLDADLPARQACLVAKLQELGGGAWQRDLVAAGFQSGIVQALVRRERLVRELRLATDVQPSPPSLGVVPEMEVPRTLTDEQTIAIETLKNQPEGGGVLLWGITGSGKTEVYLQLAADELAAGRHVLVLTPEIGLIPQLVDRCRRRFGSRVLEYHSSCTERERVRTWRNSLEAEGPLVIVGTRSAIFLPLNPLGLIVLDEEHDSSYKQESPMPCYHARDLAMARVQREGGRVLLGSATPSLETWIQLAPDGPLALARLQQRISDQPLPPVQIIDMRHELADGHRRLISRALMDRLSKLPDQGEQAVVLVPRRGYSTFLSCRSCGEVMQCPHCDVALTVHGKSTAQQWLRCHWCDHRAPVTTSCGHCGSTAFKPFGAGTQRVLEQLESELEGLRLLRFDRDTTGGRDGHRRLLDQFAAGEADVLVGTQMLAKGMDLPRVTLAAVLAADGLLHRPDLRAGEQALQLLLQLAGRAGRGEEEAAERRDAGLVPFARACVLRLSGTSASTTATAAAVLAEQLRPGCTDSGWQLIGPAPAPVARVAGRSRWQLLLHGPQASALPLPSGSSLWDGLPSGVALAVDPDPLQL
jgi:primosomal protein N' (replication factor Y)